MRFSDLKNDTSMNRAPCLNDKDAEMLSKVLYYSKKVYEEALLAKESSLQTDDGGRGSGGNGGNGGHGGHGGYKD
ncbi:unnamed protein product [Rhizophagus irregularis]|nr:unnamed protein product [Rhizophagus irregularis]